MSVYTVFIYDSRACRVAKDRYAFIEAGSIARSLVFYDLSMIMTGHINILLHLYHRPNRYP